MFPLPVQRCLSGIPLFPCLPSIIMLCLFFVLLVVFFFFLFVFCFFVLLLLVFGCAMFFLWCKGRVPDHVVSGGGSAGIRWRVSRHEVSGQLVSGDGSGG